MTPKYKVAYGVNRQRDGIYRAPFTHFKINTKSIGIYYRLLRCCVLKKSRFNINHIMYYANKLTYIFLNNVCSIYSKGR